MIYKKRIRNQQSMEIFVKTAYISVSLENNQILSKCE